MNVRYRSSMGEYLIRHPDAVRSDTGTYLRGFYSVVTNGKAKPVQFEGSFRVESADLIQPADEQLELG